MSIDPSRTPIGDRMSMSEPTVTCENCGDFVIVVPDGRGGYPPDVARRKLAKRCRAKDCQCKSRYRAGVLP